MKKCIAQQQRMHFTTRKCTEMHLRLGLCPRPRWGANRAPRALAGFKAVAIGGRKGGDGRWGMERMWE